VVRLPGQQPVARSRTEAFNLARRIVEEARAGSPFEALVGKYSEGMDAAQGGDFGVWSLVDPGYFGQEVQALGKLKLGEVSDPIDSKFGVEILKRTAADERPRYAMTAVRLQFNPSAPATAASSMQGMQKLARSVILKLKKNPKLFEDFQKLYCCANDVEQWSKGRGPVGLSEVLDKLEFDQIAAAPVQADVFVIIPKRLDPSKQKPEPQPLYDLPSPAGPSFDAIIRHTSGEVLAKAVRQLSAEAPKALNLKQAEQAPFVALLEQLAIGFLTTDEPESRMQIARLTWQELAALLGPQKFAEYQQFLNKWASASMLGNAR
jgi:hypothetical protein